MRFSRIVAITGEGISAPYKTLKNLSVRAKKKRPKQFSTAMEYLKKESAAAEPSDMHKALAEYNVPVITMDINRLHQKAGNKNVVELNGNVEDGSLVLFGQQLINFQEAWRLIDSLKRIYGEETALIVISDPERIPLVNDFIIESIKNEVYIERISEESKIREFLKKYQG